MRIDFISMLLGIAIGLWVTSVIVVIQEACSCESTKRLLKEMDRLKAEREAPDDLQK